MVFNLPSEFTHADALQFGVTDQYGRALYLWTWPLITPAKTVPIESLGKKNKTIHTSLWETKK